MAEVTTPATTPAAPAAAPVISGSPQENKTMAPASTTTPAPAASDAPIFKGIGGEFKTTAELSEYTKNLEQRLVDATAKASLTAPAAAPAPAAPPKKSIEEEIEEELFQDPKSALKKFKDHIIAEGREANQLAESKKKFWEEFYSENQDLKPLERLVQSVVTEKNSEISPLKLSDAKAFIAKEARKLVSMVKETAGIKETELSEGGGAHIAASGSGNSGPGAGGEAPGQLISFVDQIRQFRNKGRRK